MKTPGVTGNNLQINCRRRMARTRSNKPNVALIGIIARKLAGKMFDDFFPTKWCMRGQTVDALTISQTTAHPSGKRMRVCVKRNPKKMRTNTLIIQ